jgi:hypothetical protein
VVGSSILGIDPASVDHLRECARSTGRSLDLTGIDVRGEKIEEVCTNLEWQLHDLADIPQKAGIQGLTVPFPGNHFCTGCVANLGALLLMFSVDNPGVTLDNTEICCGAEVQARKESKKVFLFGNCAIGANRGLDRGIALEGCPPKVADSLVTVLNDTVGKSRARKILMSRLLKVIGFKMGIYNEVYQVINRYEYPSFDERHFQVAR